MPGRRRRWWQRPIDLDRPDDFRLVLIGALGALALVAMVVVEVVKNL